MRHWHHENHGDGMNRPCNCDNCPIGEPFVRGRDCWLCWKYWNDLRYKTLWTGIACKPKPSKLQNGPGTELRNLLKKLGITETCGCNCPVRVAQMNEWGIDGCRANIATIYGWMNEGQANFGWIEKARAATAAVSTGLAFRLDPLRPLSSLVDLAITSSAAASDTCQ